jgi:hypothetical protein
MEAAADVHAQCFQVQPSNAVNIMRTTLCGESAAKRSPSIDTWLDRLESQLLAG